ncbi:MAG: helix-turn-helix transcriptional regulator [Bdellovibrionales bacterium]
MKDQKNIKKSSPQSMLYAFESFALEASEKELDEALAAAGENPSDVLSIANAAIQRAVMDASSTNSKKTTNSSRGQDHMVLHKGLQTLISLLRRKKGLSDEELSSAARVDVEEIRRIETDAEFMPSPRTIYQLEKFFELEPKSLALMSGAISAHSSEFADGILQFAAHSKEIGKLNREEKRLLSEFVRFISEELKKRE